jgi:hypothetical protein
MNGGGLRLYVETGLLTNVESGDSALVTWLMPGKNTSEKEDFEIELVSNSDARFLRLN